MVNLIKILTLCRNKCAHDERLFNFHSRNAINDNDIHTRLAIPRNRSGTFKSGKHDLFAVLNAIKILSKKSSFDAMIKELKKAVETLNNEISIISINDILSKMGFQSNWADLKE